MNFTTTVLALSCLLALQSLHLRASPLKPLQTRANTVTVYTNVGAASGVSLTTSVSRFVVRYASAQRWQTSTMASTWEIPNNLTDPSTMPLACPQPSSQENSASTDEDCLSMVLYVPSGSSNMPAMMWIHGGSFIVGSASGPGLDGSTLAQATNSIVAVIQYRLGAFGFLSPGGETNLALRDVMTALQFMHTVLPSFGGDASRITIAGQSSGASMVRALLATPSASSLFKNAILQSDPMDYSFLSTSTFGKVNDYFVSQLPCNISETSCLVGLSTSDVLSISMSVYDNAANIDASLGSFEPMRCVTDGTLVTSPLDATASFPGQSKSIIVSTVVDEAGPVIYSQYTSTVAESNWSSIVESSLGPSRAATIVNSSFYSALPSYANNASAYDAREQLQLLGTDQVWRCPSWTFARLWAASGGTAYVGEYAVGVTYPDNSDIAYCEEGAVCHEDDIEVVFGTASNPNSNQTNLISAMQSRYKSFLATSSPDDSWLSASGETANAIVLGGPADGTKADVGACEPDFWGSTVPYDYQINDS